MFRMQQWMLGVALAVLAVAPTAAAQEMVVTGPPPVLRARLDAFLKAFNSGDAAQFEKMATEAFTSAYLKSQTADERRQAYVKMRADFGTIAFERVERRGPDAPLEINVKGSVASGTMTIELDDDHKIDGIKSSVTKNEPARR
ncbi:MAG TPA: hypothetical protein VFO19_13430 [Vicinamibacterales bacterium]|nr:hypothetical protein [Vicinamibacterales bacterium]